MARVHCMDVVSSGGTLDNLTAEGMKRFNRRMCGSRDILAQHEKFPARPLEEVKDELQHIYNLCNGQSMCIGMQVVTIQRAAEAGYNSFHCFHK